MAFMMMIFLVVGGLFLASYNTLISLKHGVEESAASIDNQLQRRSDLIPNLVTTVKSFAKHEEDVFKNVTEARERMMSASTMQEKGQASAELSSALSRLIAISENYPELKSDKVYVGLMDELAGTENRIAHARDKYNASVRKLNETIEKLPYSLFAGFAGAYKAEYFNAEESAKKPVKVDLD